MFLKIDYAYIYSSVMTIIIVTIYRSTHMIDLVPQ